MRELIRNRPLATLVTLGSNGINANHIPLHFSQPPEPFGVLRGHIARANPLWRDLASDVDTLAIFHCGMELPPKVFADMDGEFIDFVDGATLTARFPNKER